MIATTSLSDIINLSQGLATLNLAYLGISVTIIALLGGAFYLFNVKPLKDLLDKQEKTIDKIKEDARDLLTLSAEQSKESLEKFKIEQIKLLDNNFEQQQDKILLETTNKIQDVEKTLSNRIENISENKDVKLKEIIQSENNNKLSLLEKDLILNINKIREDINKNFSLTQTSNTSLKSSIKDLEEKIRELQVYKYSKEGQMGAIIGSTDLLRSSIDDYFKLKEIIKTPFDEKTFGWKITMRLKGLLKEISDCTLGKEEIQKINIELDRLNNELTFVDLVAQIKTIL